MEFGSSIGPCFKAANPPVLISNSHKNTNITLRRRKQRFSFRACALSYREFAESALEETRKRVLLEPSPLQERYSGMTGIDGKTKLQMLAFKSPKIRLLRSMAIENETMQVFDFAGFMKPEYDTPIFCANFFTSANTNIVVLDLNPLHQLTDQTDYQDKYYKNIMSIYHKYDEIFPWGGKLTGESIRFFSPLVMWTRFSSSQEKHKALFSAFLEYYQAWLEMTIQVKEEMEPSQVRANREAQHKYLTWRAQKDPGHGLLRKLVGEAKAKELLRDFLFNGVNELGTKTFIDYFPEYQAEDGTRQYKTLPDIQSRLVKLVPNLKLSTYGRLSGLKRANSSPASGSDDPTEASKPIFRSSSKQRSGLQPQVVDKMQLHPSLQIRSNEAVFALIPSLEAGTCMREASRFTVFINTSRNMLLRPCNISSALVPEQLSSPSCYGYAALNPYLVNHAVNVEGY